MAKTTLKTKIISTVAVAGLVTALVIQHQTQVRLREDNQSLQQQVDQLAQLTAENERLSNLVAQADRSLADDRLSELLRLRSEVGMLRRQTNELERLREDTRRLQASLARAGQNSTPQPAEADAAAEEQRHQAIARMNDAKRIVLAMHIHAGDNQGQLPASFDQLTH